MLNDGKNTQEKEVTRISSTGSLSQQGILKKEYSKRSYKGRLSWGLNKMSDFSSDEEAGKLSKKLEKFSDINLTTNTINERDNDNLNNLNNDSLTYSIKKQKLSLSKKLNNSNDVSFSKVELEDSNDKFHQQKIDDYNFSFYKDKNKPDSKKSNTSIGFEDEVNIRMHLDKYQKNTNTNTNNNIHTPLTGFDNFKDIKTFSNSKTTSYQEANFSDTKDKYNNNANKNDHDNKYNNIVESNTIKNNIYNQPFQNNPFHSNSNKEELLKEAETTAKNITKTNNDEIYQLNMNRISLKGIKKRKSVAIQGSKRMSLMDSYNVINNEIQENERRTSNIMEEDFESIKNNPITEIKERYSNEMGNDSNNETAFKHKDSVNLYNNINNYKNNGNHNDYSANNIEDTDKIIIEKDVSNMSNTAKFSKNKDSVKSVESITNINNKRDPSIMDMNQANSNCNVENSKEENKNQVKMKLNTDLIYTDIMAYTYHKIEYLKENIKEEKAQLAKKLSMKETIINSIKDKINSIYEKQHKFNKKLWKIQTEQKNKEIILNSFLKHDIVLNISSNKLEIKYNKYYTMLFELANNSSIRNFSNNNSSITFSKYSLILNTLDDIDSYDNIIKYSCDMSNSSNTTNSISYYSSIKDIVSYFKSLISKLAFNCFEQISNKEIEINFFYKNIFRYFFRKSKLIISFYNNILMFLKRLTDIIPINIENLDSNINSSSLSNNSNNSKNFSFSTNNNISNLMIKLCLITLSKKFISFNFHFQIDLSYKTKIEKYTDTINNIINNEVNKDNDSKELNIVNFEYLDYTDYNNLQSFDDKKAQLNKKLYGLFERLNSEISRNFNNLSKIQSIISYFIGLLKKNI